MDNHERAVAVPESEICRLLRYSSDQQLLYLEALLPRRRERKKWRRVFALGNADGQYMGREFLGKLCQHLGH